MSRVISPEMEAELAEKHVEWVLLVALDWPDGWVYVHSGLGELMYAGNKYLGVGNLGDVDSISDNGEIGNTKVKLTLSGLDQAMVASCIDDDAQGREGYIYLGVLDQQQRLLDSNIYPLFAGEINDTTVRQGKSPAITVTLKVDSINRARRLSDRYNDESHRKRHPGDFFFRYVAKMVDRPFYWGSKKDAIPLKDL